MQEFVTFKLSHDLPEKSFGYRSGMAEDPESRFGVFQNILDREAKGNYGGLPVFPRPEVKVAVWISFDLAYSFKSKLVVDKARTVGARQHIDPPTNPDQKVVKVGLAKKPYGTWEVFLLLSLFLESVPEPDGVPYLKTSDPG